MPCPFCALPKEGARRCLFDCKTLSFRRQGVVLPPSPLSLAGSHCAVLSVGTSQLCPPTPCGHLPLCCRLLLSCLSFFLRILPLFPSARRFSLFLPPIGGIVSAELNDDDAAAAPCGREQNKKAGTPAGGAGMPENKGGSNLYRQYVSRKKNPV